MSSATCHERTREPSSILTQYASCLSSSRKWLWIELFGGQFAGKPSNSGLEVYQTTASKFDVTAVTQSRKITTTPYVVRCQVTRRSDVHIQVNRCSDKGGAVERLERVWLCFSHYAAEPDCPDRQLAEALITNFRDTTIPQYLNCL